jgi:hypothetical protein
MKFQILNVFINKCIQWMREKRNSVRVVIRGRAGIEKGRKTNNGKRSAIEMTLAKHS